MDSMFEALEQSIYKTVITILLLESHTVYRIQFHTVAMVKSEAKRVKLAVCFVQLKDIISVLCMVAS